ncbi:hypothetical protein PVAP13_9NG213300 [Panicum virgatum]|uniref:Carbohydrate kinase PfkB domain-containing protein n=1 Tax=Panicum virgatum TaxID=38727 RepID=A0A8T0MIU5_PANVG|nr:hypothetical protein PVAP13_9NG213300 [Panicum virgatum]
MSASSRIIGCPCSMLGPPLPVCRSQIHYKTNILGKNMAKPTFRLLNRTVNAASRTSQNPVEGSSDEDSDSETSTKKKRAPRRGRKKATTETLEGERKESQISSGQESPEETKKVKRRGRKKAATTASSEEGMDKAKEPKKRGRRKDKTTVESSDNEGDDQGKDLMPSNEREYQTVIKNLADDLETKIELTLQEDIGTVDSLMPLVCCFGPAKYSFIPSGRPANRLIDHEIHDRMKDMFWSTDKFMRAPGGPSSNVALALAAIGGRVAFMGKLGDDEYGQSLLYYLNINGVQTRAVCMDPSAPTAVSLMKVTSKGSLKTNCVKPCAEDCFLQSDINPAVLKEVLACHGSTPPKGFGTPLS